MYLMITMKKLNTGGHSKMADKLTILSLLNYVQLLSTDPINERSYYSSYFTISLVGIPTTVIHLVQCVEW